MMNLTEQIQKEIRIQLEEADHRLSKRGWFPLVAIMIALFGAIYFIDIQFKAQNEVKPAYQENTMKNLENKIIELETRINDLEEQLK